jgi:3-hydroxyisobutyrate dehydrogenase
MIAYLGTGLLGANFVKAMLRQDLQVNVWNRTADKAKALEADGAKAFDDVADAVRGAERIHLTLSDDAAVNEVLEKAAAGFKEGAVIVDHTTTSAAGAVERTARWKERGFRYQHAPVFMGPQNAYDSSGYMLVSGDETLVLQLEPALAKMTGKVLNFGPEPGRAAGIKLLGNGFLMFLTAGFSDVLALAKSMDIPSADLVTLMEAWNPGAMAPARLKRMLAADYDNPSWELQMARKDARLMIEAAESADRQLATLPAIAAEMDRHIAQGQGNKDWTVMAQDNV